jgi:flavin reductase (DIM6/NTAB) family NADH-FMN oxidoreductase RutF
LVKKTKELVINIPTADILRKVVACGNVSGRAVDKFVKFSLTAREASRVSAPLIEERYVNQECRVVDSALVSKYNLFILEVLAAWIDPSVGDPRTIHHRGHGNFMIAGRSVKTRSRAK